MPPPPRMKAAVISTASVCATAPNGRRARTIRIRLSILRRLVRVIGRLSQVFDRDRSVIRRPFAVAGTGEVSCLLLMLTGGLVVVHRCLTMVLCGFGHPAGHGAITIALLGVSICSKGDRVNREGSR